MRMDLSIRLITFHTPKNYGAVLQAYSLSKHLTKYSDDVKVIDYNTKHLQSLYPVIPNVKTLKGFIKNIICLYRVPKVITKQKKFNSFVNNNFALTKHYATTDDLYNEKWGNCIFVTGSDQVFNPNRILEERKAFYLDFVPKESYAVSYAASFGVKAIPDEKKDEIKKYLSRFQRIAVREEAGKAIVADISNKQSQVVLDPVFLHDKAFWNEVARPYKKSYEHYLLYYHLLNSRESGKTARKIADQLGLKLVVITQGDVREKVDAVLRDVGPEEFLYLMSHADFIVTDAFHGVAFSIIFQKQFVFSDTSVLTNGRGLELIKKMDIYDKSYCQTYSADEKINYIELNELLGRYIQESCDYLDFVIKE